MEKDFIRKTQWFILWRLVFVSFFLLITVILQEKGGIPFFPFSSRLYIWIALQYGFSLLYLIWILSGWFIQGAALTQLVVDGFFVSIVVFLTGGIESFFPYLYFLVIVAGGTLFHRPGGLLTALYVSLLYGLLLLVQGGGLSFFNLKAGILSTTHTGDYYLYQIIMHTVGFFLVGYLSSAFAEQTVQQKNQIEIQKKNIDQLEGMNRIIIDNLDFGLVTLDPDDHIQTINPAGEMILGCRSDQLKDRPLQTVFPNLAASLGAEKKGEMEEKTNRLEFLYQTPQGQTLPIGCSFNAVRKDQNSGIGKILSFKDISNIKTMEAHLRQVDRLALMGKMAAGIAHEIRNPLASISGSIQVLQDDYRGDETGERLLNIVSREVGRLEGLVNSFLTFSRPVQEAGALTDVSEILLETVDLVKRNRETSSLIVWDLAVEPGLIINISSGEMSQIAWNLIINAVQVLEERGRISIRAESRKTDPGNSWVELVFQDDGPGIPEPDRMKIFDPFYTTKEAGTGLGLSIVQKIITERGGKIEVSSPPGKGTAFIILFPRSNHRPLTNSPDVG
jgi:two-component system, NtrC family, sensor histidine kinase PilS